MTAQPASARGGACPTVPLADPQDLLVLPWVPTPLALSPAPAAPPDPIPPPEPVLGPEPLPSRFGRCSPGKGGSPTRRRLDARGYRRDQGSVTVEMVGVIPLLVAVTLAMVGLVAVARDQVLAQGAAREGAREAALGGNQGRAVAAARAVVPAGRTMRVTVASDGQDRVRVTVELETRMLFGVPAVTVHAEGVALREPGPAVQPAGP